MPNTRAPFLPAEILTQIFGYLPHDSIKDLQTLYSAALVSHSWNSAAVPVLYDHAEIKGSESDLELLDRKSLQLLKTLSSSPNIAALVNSVSYYCPTPKNIYSRGLNPPLDNSLYKLVKTTAFNLTSVEHLTISKPNHKLASLLISYILPVVRSFSLEGANIHDISFPIDTKYPQLRDLEIRNISLEKIYPWQIVERPETNDLINEKLSTFLGSSTGLRSLRLTSVSGIDKLLQKAQFTNLCVLEIDIADTIEIYRPNESATRLEEITKFLSVFITSHALTMHKLALSNFPHSATSTPLRVSCPALKEILIRPGCSTSIKSVCDLLDQLPSLRRVEILIPYEVTPYPIPELSLILTSLHKLRDLVSLSIQIAYKSLKELETFLLNLSNAVPGLQELTLIQTIPPLDTFASYLEPFKSLKRVHLGHVFVTPGYTNITNDTIAKAFANVESLEEVVVTMRDYPGKEYMKAIGIERFEGGARGVYKGEVSTLECFRVLASPIRSVS